MLDKKQKRGSELSKLAPTVTESPQLQQGLVRLQARTWRVRRDLKLIRVSSSASKKFL